MDPCSSNPCFQGSTVYIHTHIYIYSYIYVIKHTHTHTHTHTHIYIYIYIYIILLDHKLCLDSGSLKNNDKTGKCFGSHLNLY